MDSEEGNCIAMVLEVALANSWILKRQEPNVVKVTGMFDKDKKLCQITEVFNFFYFEFTKL